MTHAGGALINPDEIFKKIALAPGMRVADLGCGRTGHFVFPASKAVGDTGVVYAVEIVKNILESIKSRCRSEGYNNVQTVWSDIEREGSTPIPDHSLSACFLVNVLYMVKDRISVLKEVSRLLEKEGVAVIIDWSKNLGPLGPGPDQKIKEDELRVLAGKAGLAFKENVNVGDYHFCALFKRL
jgi:ubiquinone/menaquinone biosynthesis C-methylase UbiE